jgi:ABC-type polysaccharide/polyol phosphate export permease
MKSLNMAKNYQALYRYRSLLGALVVRHLSMRYRGSVLGFLWTFLNPMALMLVYALVFKYYIRFDQVENYTIFLFVGLLPWLWVSSALAEGTSSITSSGHLITKSMFPPQILPTVYLVTTLFNFLFSIPILLAFMFFAGLSFHSTLILFPALLFLQFVFLQGLVLALSTVNVYYRDVQHVLSNLLTFLFFLSPILYPPQVVPAGLQFTLDVNPLAVFTMAYHSIFLHGEIPSAGVWLYMIFAALVSLIIGNMIFERHREGFAELL